MNRYKYLEPTIGRPILKPCFSCYGYHRHPQNCRIFYVGKFPSSTETWRHKISHELLTIKEFNNPLAGEHKVLVTPFHKRSPITSICAVAFMDEYELYQIAHVFIEEL